MFGIIEDFKEGRLVCNLSKGITSDHFSESWNPRSRKRLRKTNTEKRRTKMRTLRKKIKMVVVLKPLIFF